MYTKIFLILLSIILIIGLSVASAEIAVGVKKGDWIEYNVTYTGTPLAGHDVTWARMDILDVLETSIRLKITSKYTDGSKDETLITLNLEHGELGDDFIIPANLTRGSTFYDINFGNVSINSIEQRQYAGLTRSVLQATRSNNTYVWDQITGISVEGTTDIDTFSMHMIVDKTNIWSSSTTLDTTAAVALLVLLVGITLSTAILTGLLLKRRKS